MKKQLSVLAGSVLLASGANALTVGGDVLAVFNTAGSGSFYQFTGVTAADLASGTGFSIDVSAAQTALGGTIESYALIGLLDGDGTGAFVNGAGQTFNYDEGVYVENNGGLITAGSVADAAATDNTNAGNRIFAIEAFLTNAVLGANGEGSLGDFDSNANVASLLTSGVNAVVLNAQQEVGFSTAPSVIEITSPTGAIAGLSLTGTTFAATGEATTVIPVPAAAWLFGSALVGLGVVRRK